jgi:hypothetical protein
MGVDPWFWYEAGSRLYDVWSRRSAPYSSDEFTAKLSEFHIQSLELVRKIDSLNPLELQQGSRSVLKMLALTVEAYHRKSGVRVNANYMIPYAPTAELLRRALFVQKNRGVDSFQCFLRIEAWADPSDGLPEDVILPVEQPVSTEAPLLFGAPKAFVLKESDVIRDTSELWKITQSEPYFAIRREIDDFFKAQRDRFQSFASFPVPLPPVDIQHTCSHPVLAVVNMATKLS